MDIALMRNETASFFYYTGNRSFLKKDTTRTNFVGDKDFFENDDYIQSRTDMYFVTKEEILSFYPKSFDERISQILSGLAKRSKFVGNIITLSRDELISALFIRRFSDDVSLLDDNTIVSQLWDVINHLEDNKYIDAAGGVSNTARIKLLPEGWKKAEEDKKNNENQHNEIGSIPLEQLTDDDLKELIRSAEEFYEKGQKQLALEKLWDAFERMKTYYTNLDKKNSANKIVNNMSLGIEDYRKLYADEFKALTDIGNGFRIRHHETDTISIEDERHLDYFYLRCMSLLSTAVKFL